MLPSQHNRPTKCFQNANLELSLKAVIFSDTYEPSDIIALFRFQRPTTNISFEFKIYTECHNNDIPWPLFSSNRSSGRSVF